MVQKTLANWVADILSDRLETKVEIGSINPGFLNRLTVNDLLLSDQNGVEMLKVARVSAAMKYMKLLRGKIEISTAQLFSPTIQLYADSLGGRPNYQFLIDAFSSKSDEPSSTDLRINTLLLRHANVSYDVLNQPHSQIVDSIIGEYTLDLNHLALQDLSMNLSLKSFTSDSLNLSVRRLSLSENNSGLRIEDLGFSIEADKDEALVSNVLINLPGSTFAMDSVRVYYSKTLGQSTFGFSKTLLRAQVVPADFRSLLPLLKNMYTPYNINLVAECRDNKLNISELKIKNPLSTISLDMHGECTMINGKPADYGVWIDGLHIRKDGLGQIISESGITPEQIKPLLALGSIDLAAEVVKEDEWIVSKGKLLTLAGNIDYNAVADSSWTINGKLTANKFNIGKLLNKDSYGVLNGVADVQVRKSRLENIKGKLDLKSDAIDIVADIAYNNYGSRHDLLLNSDIGALNPYKLTAAKEYKGEVYSGRLDSHITGTNIDDLTGYANIHNLVLTTDSTDYRLDSLNISIQRLDDISHMELRSDFADVDVDGDVYPSRLVREIIAMLQPHLPSIIGGNPVTPYRKSSNFTYSARISPNQFSNYFTSKYVSLNSPAEIYGYVNALNGQLNLNAKTKQLNLSDKTLNNVQIICDNTPEGLKSSLSTIIVGDESAAKINLNATASNSVIDGNVKMQLRGETDINLDVNSSVSLSDSLNRQKINIEIGSSLLTVNDTLWHISPSHITLYGNDLSVNDLQIYGGADSYLKINGSARDGYNDSIVAQLRNIELEYVLDAVDFTTVSLGGNVSGRIVVDDPLSGSPLLNADLTVDNLLFEDGSMGRAIIKGGWDDKNKSILLNAWMTQIGTKDNPMEIRGRTELHGFVSPANEELRLDITADKTNADFLNSYLSGIFHPIKGVLTGTVSVVGPFDDINLIGEVDADLELAMLATDVPYKAINQHASLREGIIDFVDVVLYDKYGNSGVVNGKVTHKNLANFNYEFEADFNNLLAYDEKTFNENHFYATIFGNGSLRVHGSDGHPMYITANITPTKGSVFAYDSASPDAISANSFIEFRDMTPMDSLSSDTLKGVIFDYFDTSGEESDYFVWNKKTRETEQTNSTRDLYKGDLYMDFNVNLNENCQIKLRMDNTSDGYITTYGQGGLTAKYHNKGSLELFGTYSINRGSYRMYMQDLIYKDLLLQSGSSVEFNGAPFDASIHLICHYLVNAVPLSDLTNTTAYSSNNKVKVNCILDVTGKLGNMAFKFDLEIPNVSDEIRQLVRSMINSEEEMNTQIIYLLALGRFYPSSMTRLVNENTSSSAVNSIVSSTLSGQLNNMIGNLVGNNSNWNFGTGIVTGEKGWDDLDVEGTLSGRLFDDRLLINGSFGYRDNTLKNTGEFIGDFEVRWRLKKEGGNIYLKAYNQANDRYFTKSTLNTQGIGLSYIHDFESWKTIFKK